MDSDIQALFSQDLTSVDISRPLIQPGPVVFTIGECQIKPTKRGDKQMLVITLKTAYDTVSTKGDKINPGFTLTDRVILTADENRTSERVMQDLKRLQVACGRSGPFGQPQDYIGSRLTATVSVEVDPEGQYGDQNRVRYLKA